MSLEKPIGHTDSKPDLPGRAQQCGLGAWMPHLAETQEKQRVRTALCCDPGGNPSSPPVRWGWEIRLWRERLIPGKTKGERNPHWRVVQLSKASTQLQ